MISVIAVIILIIAVGTAMLAMSNRGPSDAQVDSVTRRVNDVVTGYRGYRWQNDSEVPTSSSEIASNYAFVPKPMDGLTASFGSTFAASGATVDYVCFTGQLASENLFETYRSAAIKLDGTWNFGTSCTPLALPTQGLPASYPTNFSMSIPVRVYGRWGGSFGIDTAIDGDGTSFKRNARQTGGVQTWETMAAVPRQSTGRWYWEQTINTLPNIGDVVLGVGDVNPADGLGSAVLARNGRSVGYRAKDGALMVNGVVRADGAKTYGAGDTISVSIDIPSNEINFYRNCSLVWSSSVPVSPAESSAAWTGGSLATTLLGSFSDAPDTISVRGGGRGINVTGGGITGTGDSGYFAHQALVGDGEIIARVKPEMFQGPASSVGGVVIRTGVVPESDFVGVFFRPSGEVFGASRVGGTVTGSYAEGVLSGVSPAVTAARWVKINRTGTTITRYLSADAVTWTQVGETTISGLGSTLYAGFFVSAGTATASGDSAEDLASLEFGSVQFNGGGRAVVTQQFGVAAMASVLAAGTEITANFGKNGIQSFKCQNLYKSLRTTGYQPGWFISSTGAKPAVLLSMPKGVPNTLVGNTSPAVPVHIKNIGGKILTLGGLSTSSPFSMAGTCSGVQLLPGTACTDTVQFAPTLARNHIGKIQASIGGNAAAEITFSATGYTLPGGTTFAPAVLNFGHHPVSQLSSPMTVTLTNPSALPVNIRAISVAEGQEDFFVSSTCGPAIPAAGTCPIQIRFAPVSYVNDQKQGRLQVDLESNGAGGRAEIILTGVAEIDCSVRPGYVPVPGHMLPDGTYVPPFCAMKFEAKNDNGAVASVAAGAPWTNVSWFDAKAACEAGSVQLMSENQWLSLAHQAAARNENWTGGTKGSGSVYQGNTDGSPASTQAATSTDSDGYYNTGNGSGSNQRRTISLANGEIIWDLGGNASEWVNFSMPYGSRYASGGKGLFSYWIDDGAGQVVTGMPANKLPLLGFNAAQGLGRYYDGESTEGGYSKQGLAPDNCGADGFCSGTVVFLRGGSVSDGANGGLFGLNLNYGRASPRTETGFRCSFDNFAYSRVVPSPSSLIFAKTTSGATSLPQRLMLKNPGYTAITISAPAIVGGTGDYSIVGTNCASGLAPGEECSVDIRFSPQSEATLKSDYLRVTGVGTEAFSVDVPLISQTGLSCGNGGPCAQTWETGAWSAWDSSCSATATRTRTVACVNQLGDTVADALCAAVEPKPAESEVGENYAGCAYAWNTGSWGSWSSECSPTATRNRTVVCTRSDGVPVADSFCTTSKPTESETASIMTDCAPRWVAGPWGPWSDSCTPYQSGHATGLRTVECRDGSGVLLADSACSAAGPKPSAERHAPVKDDCNKTVPAITLNPAVVTGAVQGVTYSSAILGVDAEDKLSVSLTGSDYATLDKSLAGLDLVSANGSNPAQSGDILACTTCDLGVKLVAGPEDGSVRSVLVNVGSGPAATGTFTVISKDTTPDAFLIPAVSGAAGNTQVTSAEVSITGIDSPVSVYLAGASGAEASTSCDGSTWSAWATSGSATLTPVCGSPNPKIRLRMLSAPKADGSSKTLTVLVGGMSANWTVTTRDTTPNPFSFVDAALSGTVTSNSVTISGIDSPAPLTITRIPAGTVGGEVSEVSINGGAWGDAFAAGLSLSSGQTLQLRSNQGISYLVQVGDYATVWTLSGPAVCSPASVTITTTGAGSLTAPACAESARVEMWAGGGRGSTRSTTGGGGGGGGGGYSRLNAYPVVSGNSYNYSVGAGSTVGTSPGGDTWWVATGTGLAVGGASVNNNIATGGAGGAAASGVGDVKFTGGAGFTYTAGTVGGGGGSSAGTAANGTSATGSAGAVAPAGGGNGGAGSSNAGATAGTQPGGGGGGAYRSSGTRQGGNGGNGQIVVTWNPKAGGTVDKTPAAFAFTAVNGAVPFSLVSSNTVTITGIDAPTPVNVSGTGAPAISINGGAWVASGVVTTGQTVVVRLTSGAPGTSVSATVNVGGVSANFDVTSGGVAGPLGTSLNFGATSSCLPYPGVLAPAATATCGESNVAYFSGLGAATTPSLNVANLPSQATLEYCYGACLTGGPASGSLAANYTAADGLKVQASTSGSLGYNHPTEGTPTEVTVRAGSMAGTWALAHADTWPSGLHFLSKTGDPDQFIESNIVTVSGLDQAIPVEVVSTIRSWETYGASSAGGNGEMSINGGAWVTSGTINTGDTLRLRVKEASETSEIVAVLRHAPSDVELSRWTAFTAKYVLPFGQPEFTFPTCLASNGTCLMWGGTNPATPITWNNVFVSWTTVVGVGFYELAVQGPGTGGTLSTLYSGLNTSWQGNIPLGSRSSGQDTTVKLRVCATPGNCGPWVDAAVKLQGPAAITPPSFVQPNGATFASSSPAKVLATVAGPSPINLQWAANTALSPDAQYLLLITEEGSGSTTIGSYNTGALLNTTINLPPNSAAGRYYRTSVIACDNAPPYVGCSAPTEVFFILSNTPACATLVPPSFDYGTVPVGQSHDSAAFTLTNGCPGFSETFTDISLTSSSATFAIIDNSCGTELLNGQSCSFKLRFSPSVVGSQTALVSIQANKGGSGFTLESTAQGTAVVESMTVTPATLNFGGVDVGSAQDSANVTVANEGGTTVATPVITAPANFSIISNTCSANLSPGASCTFRVRFAPAVPGAVNGTVSVVSGTMNRSLAVSGFGQTYSLGVNPAAIAFGNANVGQTLSSVPVTVSNTGSMDLALPIISAPTGFSVSSNTCSGVLVAGGTCTFIVDFTPTLGQSYSGNVSIVSGTVSGTISVSGTGLLAGMSLSPTTLTFGNVNVGSSLNSATVTLTNTGNTTLATPTLTPPAGFSIQSNTCTAPIAQSGTCTFVVRFTPTLGAAYSGAVSITSGTATGTVSVSGTGIVYSGSVNPGAVAFGNVDIGLSLDSTLITFSNTGNGTLAAPTITPPAGFSIVSSTCSAALAPAGTCQFRVRFSPTLAQAYSGNVSVVSGTVSTTVAVSGTGISYALSLSPTSLAFGNVDVGSNSTSTAVTLTNTGTGSLAAPTITPPTGYSIVSNGCTAAIPAGGSCNFSVRFAPVLGQAYNGTVTVTSGAASANLNLTGTGVSYGLSISPNSFAFGNVNAGSTADSSNITLTNTGTGSLTAPVFTPPTGYSVVSNGCTGTLNAGASCVFQVRFAPTLGQAYNGNLSIVSGATSTSVALTGTGVSYTLTAGPTPAAFGNQNVGSTTDSALVTVTNTGTGTLVAPTITAPTGFSIVSSTCSASLAPTATCQFRVRFSPTLAQAYSGNVTVTSGTANASFPVSGTGLALTYTLSVAPGSAAFGNVDVGSNANSGSVTVTNTGTGTLVAPTITPPTGFSIQSSTCSASLAPTGSCTFVIRFSPTLGQAYNGNVTVVSGAASGSVAVSGTGIAYSLTAGPAPANFGNITVGNTADSALVTVTNTGNGTLAAPTITAPTGFSIVSSTCSAALAPAATCQFRVRFSPTLAQAYSGNVTVVSGTASANVAVAGTGGALTYTLSVAPGTAAFGNVDVGSNANSGSITVTNTGTGSLTTPTITPPTGYSIQSNTCTASLAPSATCTFVIRFTPTLGQAYNGNVTVVSGGASGSVAVSGTGISYSLTAGPAPANFGNITVGASSADSALITVTNTGNGTLAAPTLTAPTGFSIQASTCSAALAPAGTCQFRVRFSPTLVQAYSGNVTVVSGTASANVPVAGTGVAVTYTLSAAPAFAAFGNVDVGSSANSSAITVTNTGTGSLVIPTITPPAGYSIQSNTCTAALAPAGTCTFVIRFSPTLGQAYNGNVTVVSGAASGNVAITGTGISYTLTAGPTPAAFGNQNVGSNTDSALVVVTNTGTGTLAAPTITAPTGFSIVSSTCSAALAPTGTCQFRVRFSPTLAQAYSGNVTVTSGAASTNFAVSGTGLALTYTLSVAPVSTAFGNVDVGSSANSSAITVTNTGTGALAIPTITPPAGFSIQSNTCTAALSAGATCTFVVRFSPTLGQAYSGNVTVVSGAASGSVAVSGNGLTYTLSVSPGSTNFGNVSIGMTSDSPTLTVTNTGTASLAIPTITPPAGFSVISNACTGSIAAGGTCTFALRFTPTLQQAYSGNVTVVSGAASATTSVAGTGTAPATYTLSVTPGNVNFGYVTRNTNKDSSTLTVTNTGTGTLTTPTITPPTGYSIVSNGCSGSLAPAATCSFVVRFTPTALVSYNNSVSVTANAGANDTLDVAGQGIHCSIPSPTTLTTPGAATLPVPLCTTSATVELWGGGGNGGTRTNNGVTAGGGGGAYSRLNSYPVVPMTAINYTVGGAGGDTFFVNSATALAKGGTSVGNNSNTAGAGGSAALGVGDVKFSGGNGAAGTLSVNGGGGGSSAGPAANGNNASGVTGGLAVTGGGAGGNGTTAANVAGNPGTAPGGGGGGVWRSAGNITGGSGGSGQIIITWEYVPFDGLALSEASLSFGNVAVGSSQTSATITVTNSGGTALVPAVSAPAGYSIQSSTCGSSLDPTQTCTFTVRFSPTLSQAYNGNVVVSAGSASVNLPVTGTGVTYSLGLSTGTINFGNVTVGNTQTSSAITLTNTGTGTLVTPTITAPAGFTVVGSTCSASLAPAATCSFQVQFGPALAQAYSGNVTITSGTVSESIPVSGTGIAATYTLSLSPPSVTFGNVDVGNNANSSTITVTNTGTGTLAAPTITPPSGFSIQSSTCSAALAPSGTCTFVARFSPTLAQAYSGNVTVVSGAASSNLPVSGTGISYSLTVGPGSYAFGNVNVGNTPTSSNITVTNTGNGTLALPTITPPSGYSVVANTCTGPISPAGTCTFQVQFTPTLGQAYNGNLTVSSSGASGTLALTGTGIVYSLTAAPTPAAFGNVTVGNTVDSALVTVTNTGNGSLAIPTITAPTGFSIVSSTCTAALAPAGTCQFRVRFSPTLAQAYSGNVTVVSGTANASFAVSGTGGALTYTLSAAPGTATFGNVDVGSSANSSTITVINTGTGSLATPTITPPAGYSIQSNTCTAALAPAATCTFVIRFSPTLGQAYNGNVTVVSGGASGAVAVTGTGISYSLTAAPTPAAFGNVTVGNTADSALVTVTNTGNGSLAIPTITAPTGFSIVSSTCTAALAPTATCQFRVRFSPTLAQAYSGNVTVVSGTASGTLPVSGTGVAATYTLSVAPGTAAFGNVDVGSSANSGSITVTNTGTGSLTTPTITPPTGYSIQSNTCTASLAPAATCTFVVRFTPTLGQAYNGNVTVVSGSASGSVAVTGTGIVYSLTAAPAPANFGNITVGSSSADSALVIVTNTGNGTLATPTITAPTGFSVQASTCSAALAPAGTCQFRVRFSPTLAQAYSGNVTVVSGTASANVPVAGTGVAVTYTLSAAPATATFGNVDVGSSLNSSSITVTNTGTGSLAIPTITPPAGYSIQSNTCTAALAPAGTCSFVIRFSPTLGQAYNGNVTVTSGAASGSVAVTGTGISYALTAGPTPAAFGSQNVGSSTDSALVTVTNTGNGTLAIPTITAPTGFSIVSSTCSAALAPTATCQFRVRFSPTLAQAYSGNVTVTSGTASANFAVSGTGVALTYTLTAAPAPANFGNITVGSSSADSAIVTVTNTGTGTLVAPTITPPAGFSIQSSTCSASLAPAATCSFRVRFSPTLAQVYSGNVTVVSGSASANVPVAGTGVSLTYTLSAAPGTATFGNVDVGSSANSSTITVTNTGTGSLTTPTITPPAGYSIQSNTCTASLAPAATCTFVIRFSPTLGQAYNGNVTVVSGSASGSVAVTGTGINYALTAGPTPAAFGNQNVGSNTDSALVTVTNTGNGSLAIPTITAPTGFSIVSSTCTAALAPTATCQFLVRFSPTLAQAYSGNVTVTSGTASANFPVSGTGVALTYTLTAAPAPANFGSITVGSSSADSAIVTVTNTGTGTLVAPTITPPAGFSIQSSTCSASLAPAATCTFRVRFSPTLAQVYSGNVTVVSGAASANVAVAGTGVNLTYTLTAAPAPANFGNINVGSSSADSSIVTVTNTGTGTLVAPTITPPAGFSIQSSTCSASLAPAATCTFRVRFTPTLGQVYSGNVTVVSGTASANVPVAGTGISYSLTVGPTPAAFGSRNVGTNTDSALVTVTNTGTGTLAIPTITAPTGFSIINSTCTATIAPAGTCAFNVRFSPTLAQAYSGNVTVTSGTATGNFAVSGTGVALTYTMAASPSTIAFGTVNVGFYLDSATVTLTNTGTGTLVAPTFTPPIPVYTIVSNTCTGSLAPSASCTFQVRFTPLGGSSYPGSLSITSGSASASVSLSGTGSSTSYSFTLTPSSINYNTVDVGFYLDSATVTLTNTGTGVLAVPSFTPPNAAYTIVNNTCTGTVALAGSCNFKVRFTPSAGVSYDGNLTVSASSASANLALTGTGVTYSLGASSASVAFGSVNVGSSQDSGNITLTNTGNGALPIPTLTPPSGYSVVNSNCNLGLAPGGTCTFQLRFNPSLPLSYTGNLTITAGSATTNISISGTGISGCAVPAPHVTSTAGAGSVVVPACALYARVELWGGGGRGARMTIIGGGIGGGGGAYAQIKFHPVVPGQTLTYSVGAGSTSGTTPGGDTVFMSTVGRAKGGQSSPDDSDYNSAAGGDGATSIGDIRISGMTVSAGAGGKSGGIDETGAGGAPGDALGGYDGKPGTIPGGGGGGAFRVSGSAKAGGNGANGKIKITWLSSLDSLVFRDALVTSDFPSFATGYSKPLVVINNGQTSLGALSYQLPAGLTLNTTTCAAGLAPGQSCSFTVKGDYSLPATEVVSVTSGGAQASTSLEIRTPVGYQGTTNVFFNMNLLRATTRVGTYYDIPVKLLNRGDVAVTMGANILFPGSWSILNNTCSSIVLEPYKDCTFTARFTPSIAGSHNGLLIANWMHGINPGRSVADVTGLGLASAFELSTSAINFGNVNLGSYLDSATITVSNPSAVATPAPNFAAANVTNQFSIESNTCATTIPGLGSCTFKVRFNPDSAQSYSHTLELSDGVISKSLSLTGTGVIAPTCAAHLAISQNTVDFGKVATGASVNSNLISILNRSSVSLASVTVNGSGSPFAISSNTCAGALAAGEACSFKATYSPAAAGTHAGSVTVGCPLGSIANAVTLNGIGTSTLGVADASLWDFGTIKVGTSRDSDVITFTNIGTTTTGPATLSATPGFSIVSNTCSVGLNPTQSCTFVVRFTPSSAIDYTGTARILVTTPALIDIQIPLYGKGATYTEPRQQGPLILIPTSYAFGQVQSGKLAKSVTLRAKNIGNARLPALKFEDAGAYYRVPEPASKGRCGPSLAPGEECTYTVALMASTAPGAHNNSMLVRTADNRASATLTLTGQSVTTVDDSSCISLSTSEVFFGDVQVESGTRALPVKITSNCNDVSLNLFGVPSPPTPLAMSGVPVATPVSLAAGDSINATVTLASLESFTYSLQLNTKLGGSFTLKFVRNGVTYYKSVLASFVPQNSARTVAGHYSDVPSIRLLNIPYGETRSYFPVTTWFYDDLGPITPGATITATAPSPFSITPSTCPTFIAKGHSCTVTPTVTPNSYAPFAGELLFQVMDDNGGPPAKVSLETSTAPTGAPSAPVLSDAALCRPDMPCPLTVSAGVCSGGSTLPARGFENDVIICTDQVGNNCDPTSCTVGNGVTIGLSWSASPGAQFYRVWSVLKGGALSYVDVAASELSHMLPLAAPDGILYYRTWVEACNVSGCSASEGAYYAVDNCGGVC